MDYAKIAQDIIASCGGYQNISSITHCSTRLRLFINSKGKVNQDRIKSLDGVLGTVYSNDELQIILGKNLIPIYNETVKSYEGKQGSVPDDDVIVSESEPEKPKNKLSAVFNKVIGFVSASVTPMIPGLVAGGMLKVFLLLITLVVASFADTQTYKLLSMLADIPFYFMPVFVAYGAAKKLGGTPIFAMIASASLVYPNFVNLLAGEDPVSILNIPVMVVKYNGLCCLLY